MNKYKSNAGLMLARSLESSRVPLYLSTNYPKSEIRNVAEGINNNLNTSESPSTIKPKRVQRKKSTGTTNAKSIDMPKTKSRSEKSLAIQRNKSTGITTAKTPDMLKTNKSRSEKSLVINDNNNSKTPTGLALKRLKPVENITKGWGGSTHQFQLAVDQGNVYITNKFRPAPEFNSFEPTKDLGSPGATRRWILHLEEFRDHEISFSLQRNKLTARGYQTTRKDSPKTYHQSISLPNPFCVDCLKVYRNKQIGAIIIALIPDNFPFFKF